MIYKRSDTTTTGNGPMGAAPSPGGAPTAPVAPKPPTAMPQPPAPPAPAPAPALPKPNSWLETGKQMLNTGTAVAQAWSTPQGQEAFRHYSTLKDDNVPMTDPNKMKAWDGLRNYMQTDQGKHLGTQIPGLQSQMDEHAKTLDGPLGQALRYGAPMLQHVAKTPEQFGQFLGMPMIRDIAKPALGMMGLPGLMAAYSYLSGDKEKWTNWRTLTSGLREPDNPRRIEIEKALSNAKAKANEFMIPTGSAVSSASDSLDQMIDQYLNRLRCKQMR
jgi:hypothetical protein